MLNLFQGRLLFVRITLLLATFALVTIGILTIYAAGNPAESDPTGYSNFWKKQLFFACVGVCAILLLNMIDYHWLGPISYWLYGGCLGVLALLLVSKYLVDLSPVIDDVKGAYRWIRIGSIKVQPSEFCKIIYIIALAWYLRFRKNYRSFRGLAGPFIITMFAMVLILLEPDLGTTLLLLPILFTMLFVAGAKVKHLVLIICLAGLTSPFMWGKLNSYQRSRISSFLFQNDWIRTKTEKNPTLSVFLTGRDHFDSRTWLLSSGWQPMHSKLAISSAGLTGYGFRKGPYLKYSWKLSEKHNDFIFSIVAHQWGIIGCVVVFLLYGVIFVCGIEIASNNPDPFARLIVVGILTIFAVQVIVNSAMTVGLMPITGLTLPLISYGGSSLVVSMAAIGLLNTIGRVRPFSIAGKGFEA